MRQLAVFDLDGTITRHDTFGRYVMGFLKGRPWRLAGFLMVLPVLVRFLVQGSDHGALKAAVMRCTLGGIRRAQLEAWTARFVPDLLARGVFPGALERIARHRSRGDVLVLMSASPDLYVPEIARQLGFDDCTCTGVRWNGDRLDGRLSTANCRGEEKARRLRELRARNGGAPVVAYGNAASDLAHLRLAERGILVNGSAVARELAERAGLTLESWS